ncbi:MAG: hypothetical protein DYG89_16775 [Caldilinea sp. CFX5]|nr:hypothetical protein [Caldilinea sp. CFX5]
MSDPISELKAKVDSLLKVISTNVKILQMRKSGDAIYAAYVFGLVLQAVQRVATPGSVSLKSINQAILSTKPPVQGTFIIRGAPGYIYSTAQDYGYAQFEYSKIMYEIHMGVRYFGSSKVLHEFDISIIDARDAKKCRIQSQCPSSAKTKIVFECKFYSDKLGIELGRELVGLVSDFRGLKVARLVTNSSSESVRKYLKDRVTYKLNESVTPANPEVEEEFIKAIADDLRNRLGS